MVYGDHPCQIKPSINLPGIVQSLYSDVGNSPSPVFLVVLLLIQSLEEKFS